MTKSNVHCLFLPLLFHSLCAFFFFLSFLVCFVFFLSLFSMFLTRFANLPSSVPRAPSCICVCVCVNTLSTTFTLNSYSHGMAFTQIKFKENRKVCLQCLYSIKLLKRSTKDGLMKKCGDCCKDLFDNVSISFSFYRM